MLQEKNEGYVSYFFVVVHIWHFRRIGGKEKDALPSKSEAYHCRKNSVCSKKCRQGINFRAIAKMIQYPKAARQIFQNGGFVFFDTSSFHKKI